MWYVAKSTPTEVTEELHGCYLCLETEGGTQSPAVVYFITALWQVQFHIQIWDI